MKKPMIYRCKDCPWIGSGEESARLHQEAMDPPGSCGPSHQYELWEDVMPEKLRAAGLALMKEAREIERYVRKRQTDALH